MAKKPSKSRKPAKSRKAAKTKPVRARKPASGRKAAKARPARKARAGAKPRKSPALLRAVKARVEALKLEQPGLGPDQLGQQLLHEFPELRPHLKEWSDLWPFMTTEK